MIFVKNCNKINKKQDEKVLDKLVVNDEGDTFEKEEWVAKSIIKDIECQLEISDDNKDVYTFHYETINGMISSIQLKRDIDYYKVV